MAWTITHTMFGYDSKFIDSYLLCIGRSLCIASYFEAKCQWVYRNSMIVHLMREEGKTFEEVFDHSKSMDDRMLGKTIDDLKKHKWPPSQSIEKLHLARESRNYIAHESARIAYPQDFSKAQAQGEIKSLLPHINNLVEGDSIISQWSYDIEEPKEPRPKYLQDNYTAIAKDWILAPVKPLMSPEQLQ